MWFGCLVLLVWANTARNECSSLTLMYGALVEMPNGDGIARMAWTSLR